MSLLCPEMKRNIPSGTRMKYLIYRMVDKWAAEWSNKGNNKNKFQHTPIGYIHISVLYSWLILWEMYEVTQTAALEDRVEKAAFIIKETE